MSVSRKVRFEVFKRDGFRCQYCGKTPPDVILEADHINPVSKGGNDDINNVITACFDCNRGKSKHELSKIPNTLVVNSEILIEKELQVREYNKILKRIQKRIESDIEELNDVYKEINPGYVFSEQFKVSLKRFLGYLPKMKLIENLKLADSKITNKNDIPRYFCGICWKQIKEVKEAN